MELRSTNENKENEIDPKYNDISTNQKLRKLCHEFSSNTTLHGYRYLAQEKGCRKVVWIFFMLCAIVLSVRFFVDLLKNYNSKTKTITEYDDSMQTLDFPTVSFCLSQPSFIAKYNRSTINITQEELALLYESLQPMFSSESSFNPATTEILEKLGSANVTSYKSMLKLFDMTVEDILSVDNFCKFDGEYCTINDFKEIISPTGSLCISFNIYSKNADRKKSRKYSKGGGGLDLLVDIKSQKTLLELLSKKKMYILVHPYGTFLDESQVTKLKILEPGTYNFFRIQQTKVSHSKLRYILPSIFYLYSIYNVHQNLCVHVCLINACMHACMHARTHACISG